MNQTIKILSLQILGSFSGACLAIGVGSTSMKAELSERAAGDKAPIRLSAFENPAPRGDTSKRLEGSANSSRFALLERGEAVIGPAPEIPETPGLQRRPAARALLSPASATLIPADPDTYPLYVPPKGDVEPTNFGDPFLSADTE